ncbi:MAG: hypothetical protein ACRDP6_13040 [Actinoallomurus sp.]
MAGSKAGREVAVVLVVDRDTGVTSANDAERPVIRVPGVRGTAVRGQNVAHAAVSKAAPFRWMTRLSASWSSLVDPAFLIGPVRQPNFDLSCHRA